MKKIGVLGGGQLGMMLLQEQKGIDAELYFLDPNPDCSVSSLTENLVIGDFNREEDVLAFGRNMDILTVEIEHVHTGALQQLAEDGVKVFPQPEVLELIQDKGLQKRFFSEHGFPTAPYVVIPHGADARKNRDFPFVLKSCRGGYDGKGVQIIRSEKDLRESFTGPCVVEDLADMKNELSIIVARNQSGEVRSFPAVEMEFDPDSNLVMALISPADIPFTVAKKAEEIAESLVKKLGIVGLLAVEFFLLKDDTLLVNEVAPRPHNSGHHTIEGNNTSQYQQHLKAITGITLGDTGILGCGVMVNLIGEKGHTGPRRIEGTDLIDNNNNAFLHDYLKKETRPGRKMGHVTVVNPDRQQAHDLAMDILDKVKVISNS